MKRIVAGILLVAALLVAARVFVDWDAAPDLPLPGAPLPIALGALAVAGVFAAACRVYARGERPAKRIAFSRNERLTIRETLFGKQRGRCKHCRRKFPQDIFHIDHIRPVARGGSNDIKNLQLLCPTCNSSKGSSFVG